VSGENGDEPQRPPPEASGPHYSLENVAPELADQKKLAPRALPAQMRAVCRSVPTVFDRLTLLAHEAEGEQAHALHAETKRWILGYLSQYLD